MQPYPRAPDLVWPGHLHGTGCLNARAVGTGFPTVGLRLWLGPGCGWSWVLFTPARCGLGSWVGVFGLGLWCCPSFAGCLWCSWLGFGVGLLSGPVWFPARFPCPPPFPVPVCGVGARVSAVPRPSWLGCRVVFFALFFVFFFFSGCLVSLSRALWSLPRLLSFGGCWLFFFFFCLFRCPFFPVGRCRWLGVAALGWVVPLCLFGGPVFGALWVGGLAPFCVVGGRFGGCGLFSRARPPPPLFFFFFFFFSGGGLPGCSSRCLP